MIQMVAVQFVMGTLMHTSLCRSGPTAEWSLKNHEYAHGPDTRVHSQSWWWCEYSRELKFEK